MIMYQKQGKKVVVGGLTFQKFKHSFLCFRSDLKVRRYKYGSIFSISPFIFYSWIRTIL